ncbi:MAG: ParA family protein, partial [Gammaproteobacteria bacterium]|nr:ParA family protein [Gammaproteobacteria bacterium]
TTIAALLGRYASVKLGLKVLAIDLDPQANLSQAFMRDSYTKFLDDKLPSIVEIFREYLPPSPSENSPTSINVDDVLVRDTPLGGPNLELIPSRFEFSDNLISSIKPDERVIARLIVEQFQAHDIILIDCAPTESIFTQAAYHASRYLLVPVKPEYFATIGFPLLNDSLNMFRKRNHMHSIDVAGIVINNSTYHYSGNQGGPERERAKSELIGEAQRNNWRIFENEIPFSRGFPKMMRGDFNHLGDAPLFKYFAEEFFDTILGNS